MDDLGPRLESFQGFLVRDRAPASVVYPKGARTQIIEFKGPNTIVLLVFGHENPITWVLVRWGIGFRL